MQCTKGMLVAISGNVTKEFYTNRSSGDREISRTIIVEDVLSTAQPAAGRLAPGRHGPRDQDPADGSGAPGRAPAGRRAPGPGLTRAPKRARADRRSEGELRQRDADLHRSRQGSGARPAEHRDADPVRNRHRPAACRRHQRRAERPRRQHDANPTRHRVNTRSPAGRPETGRGCDRTVGPEAPKSHARSTGGLKQRPADPNPETGSRTDAAPHRRNAPTTRSSVTARRIHNATDVRRARGIPRARTQTRSETHPKIAGNRSTSATGPQRQSTTRGRPTRHSPRHPRAGKEHRKPSTARRADEHPSERRAQDTPEIETKSERVEPAMTPGDGPGNGQRGSGRKRTPHRPRPKTRPGLASTTRR